MGSKTWVRNLSAVAALGFILTACTAGFINIGLPPVIIVGGAGIIGFLFWYNTYLKNPVDPKTILPLFVLTVACLQIHIVEEYATGFGPAMSRLFGISWTERGFIMIFALIGPTIYTLTTLGLFFRIPIAGFIAWFIFIGPGVAEFTHFIFPLLEPKIQAGNPELYSQVINGVLLENMPNYYYKTTGTYYFSGLYTAVLPMIPGIYAIIKLLKYNREHKSV